MFAPHPQVIVRRGEKVDGPPGPIVVATRNNDLQGVVDATPPERREGVDRKESVLLLAAGVAICCSHVHFSATKVEYNLMTHTIDRHSLPADLVFIQNGMLQPWLDEAGLGDNTQASSPCNFALLSMHK